jgi:hypothetical protein
MPTTLKGILINPFDKTVSNVEVRFSNGRLFKALAEKMDCKWIERVQLDRQNTVYVDEESLITDCPKSHFCFMGNPDLVLTNKAIILGQKNDPKSEELYDEADTTWSLPQAKEQILWPDVEFKGFIDSEEKRTHPVLGEVNVFSRKSIFTPRGPQDKS